MNWRERLKPGGHLHLATDWQPYAEQMLAVLGAEPAGQHRDGYARAPPPPRKSSSAAPAPGPRWDLVFPPSNRPLNHAAARPPAPPAAARGVGPSCVAVPAPAPGPRCSISWPSACQADARRMAAPPGSGGCWTLRATRWRPTACRGGWRLFCTTTGWADEPGAGRAAKQIVFQDDWLVVADKAALHAGHARRALRAAARACWCAAAPGHRRGLEPRCTASTARPPAWWRLRCSRHTGDAYQALFRDRAGAQGRYEAVAPAPARLALPRTHCSRLVEDDERFFVSREVPGAPTAKAHRTHCLGCWATLLPAPRPCHRPAPPAAPAHWLRWVPHPWATPSTPRVRAAPASRTIWRARCNCWRASWRSTTPFAGQRRKFTSACNWRPRHASLAARGRRRTGTSELDQGRHVGHRRQRT